MRRKVGSVVVALLAVGTVACSGPAAAPATTVGRAFQYALVVHDQPVHGRSVVIARVSLLKPGWVALHAYVHGAPGIVVGITPLLRAGSHIDVVATTYGPTHAGEQLMPVIHLQEPTTSSTFSYPKGDPPAIVDGRVVVGTIKLT